LKVIRSSETTVELSLRNVTAFGGSYSTMLYVRGICRPRKLVRSRNSVPSCTGASPRRSASMTPGSHSWVLEKSLR
jgi:hypothetical protein